MEAIQLQVNGQSVRLDADAERALLFVLREELGLTGAKLSCGEGECGACTVVLDGQAVRSCITPLREAAGRDVRTIEGLATDDRLHPLQQAFIDAGAYQCGYCTPGMIMSAHALLDASPAPSVARIVEAMQGNLCRCGTYPRIVRAVQQAARALQAEHEQGAAA